MAVLLDIERAFNNIELQAILIELEINYKMYLYIIYILVYILYTYYLYLLFKFFYIIQSFDKLLSLNLTG